MTRLKILTLAAAIPLAATLAIAGTDGDKGGPKREGHGMHGGHGGPGGGGGWRRGGAMFLQHQLEKVGLTAEQKTRIDAIIATSGKGDEAGLATMQAESTKLHEMLEQDKPDQKAILEQVERIGKLKTESQKNMIRTLLAVRAELTPEQRTKLKELRKERMEKRKEYMEKKGEKGAPPPAPADDE